MLNWTTLYLPIPLDKDSNIVFVVYLGRLEYSTKVIGFISAVVLYNTARYCTVQYYTLNHDSKYIPRRLGAFPSRAGNRGCAMMCLRRGLVSFPPSHDAIGTNSGAMSTAQGWMTRPYPQSGIIRRDGRGAEPAPNDR